MAFEVKRIIVSTNFLKRFNTTASFPARISILPLLCTISTLLGARQTERNENHELSEKIKPRKIVHQKIYSRQMVDSITALLRDCSAHYEQLSAQLNSYDSSNKVLQTRLDREIKTGEFRIEFWDKSGKILVASAKKVKKISLRFLIDAPYRKNEEEIPLYIVGFTPDLKPIKTASSASFTTLADGGEKTYDCMLNDSVKIYNYPKMFYYDFDLPQSLKHGGIYIFKLYTNKRLLGTGEARLN